MPHSHGESSSYVRSRLKYVVSLHEKRIKNVIYICTYIKTSSSLQDVRWCRERVFILASVRSLFFSSFILSISRRETRRLRHLEDEKEAEGEEEEAMSSKENVDISMSSLFITSAAPLYSGGDTYSMLNCVSQTK